MCDGSNYRGENGSSWEGEVREGFIAGKIFLLTLKKQVGISQLKRQKRAFKKESVCKSMKTQKKQKIASNQAWLKQSQP